MPEHLGDDVGEDRVGPLADVDRAAEHRDPAAAVDLHHRAGVRHVVPVDREARAGQVRGGREADATPGGQLPELLPPARRLDDAVDALRQAAGRHGEVVHRLLVLGHDRAPAHLRGIEAELRGDLVEVDLEGKAGLRRPVAALRAAGRLVREDAAALELVPGDPVGHGLERARVEGRGDAVGAVRPAVEPRPEVEGQDLAVLPDARSHPHEHRMAAPVRVEDLLARERGLHRPARDLGEPRDHHLVAEGVGLAAEPAAVRGRHDADVAHRHLEDLAEGPVDVVRRLGRGPERELPVRRPLGDRRVLLHRQVRVPLEEEHVLADEVSLAESLLDVAELERDQLVDVVAVAVLVDPVRALAQRGVDRHQRVERLVLDVDHRAAASAVSSSTAATAATGSPTKRTFSTQSGSSSWLTGMIPNRTGGKSRPVIDRVDAGQRRGARGVDPPDEGVRMLGPEELRVRHAREDEVVGEARLARDLRPGVDLGQPLPDDRPGGARAALIGAAPGAAPIVRSAASSTASRIFVYPVQRQRLPASAARIASRSGRGVASSRACAVRRIPGVQYPHCAAPSSAKACWSG